MKDITKFNHAQGKSEILPRGETGPHLNAHIRALEEALVNFVDKYERMPDWDIISFRGGHSTTNVIIEIWEEE